MKKTGLLLLVLGLSSTLFSQIEWVSSDYYSQYPGKLFKTLTDQFILLHGEYEGFATKMAVFDSLGNIIYSLEEDNTDNTSQIEHIKNITHLPDSSVALVVEKVHINDDGWADFYSVILQLDKEWNTTLVEGLAFSDTDIVESTSDGSFVTMTTNQRGVALVEPEGGWTWAEWLDPICYDMTVTEGDTIIIATEDGLLLRDIEGNTIGENLDYTFKKMKRTTDGNIIGINEDSIFIISSAYDLLYEIDLSSSNIEDYHIEDNFIVALTDSNDVFLLNDSLDLLNHFELSNDGQFDFISLNKDNIILSGMERYGGDNQYYQTRSTFLKEYSRDGYDYNLSHDIGLIGVGQASETIVTQIDSVTYSISFKNIPLLIKNFGDKPIDVFGLQGYSWPRIITNLSLQPGEVKEYTWDEVIRPAFIENPTGSTYNLCFWTLRPDGLMDVNADNDFLCSAVLVNSNELISEINISIFPNPLQNDFLRIEMDNIESTNSIQSFQLFNAEGKKVLQRPFSNEIDLSMINSGFYILTLLDRKNRVVYSEKLVIQR